MSVEVTWIGGDRVGLNLFPSRAKRAEWEVGTVERQNEDGSVVVRFDRPVHGTDWCTASQHELTRLED